MKTRFPAWLRHTALVLTVIMGLNGLAPKAYGALVASAPLVVSDARAEDLASVQRVLELKVVMQRLQDLGFNQDEVQQRILRASDADLHQFVVQSDQLMAGGELGFIISVLIVVLLIMLILKLAGKKIIVT